ncbi:hypothetical protein HPB52_003189 [Rhipicephalus sanguineus]|uniref:Uncharacterized protein n=1 Tax=Rhipicephalus sanguineus TaxID=34632 RepID=A0A9D4PA73_RHISA|nr:hypothetical protein HPB52_003189 [Rhipicephalus sanguineus]
MQISHAKSVVRPFRRLKVKSLNLLLDGQERDTVLKRRLLRVLDTASSDGPNIYLASKANSPTL